MLILDCSASDVLVLDCEGAGDGIILICGLRSEPTHVASNDLQGIHTQASQCCGTPLTALDATGTLIVAMDATGIPATALAAKATRTEALNALGIPIIATPANGET